MRLSNIFNHFLGVVLIIFAAITFFVFSLISLIWDGWIGRHLLIVSIFSIFPFAFGVYVLYRARKERSWERSREREVNLMKMAAQANGKITVAEAAMRLTDSVQHVDETLRDLQSRGIFEVQVSDDGVLVYKLNKSSEQRKAEAKSVI